MTDAHIDPKIDLSIDTLKSICRGDVRKLPSFIVHDDDAWPWFAKVRPAKGKIHLRRTTFNNVVVPQVPVRPGLWVRHDAQEFFIDLKPHHLEGPSSPIEGEAKNHEAARKVTMADSAGRLPDEADYGADALERSESREVERRDLEEVAARDEKGSVGSTVLSGGDTEL